MSAAAGGAGERVGILGGAFNPPHVGHLVLAQEAHARLALDRVLLVPFGQAPHRAVEDDPGRDERLALARLAAGGDERLGTSAIEVDRPGPSYMADTLDLLRQTETAIEPTLILGADQARRLRTWHAPERVLAAARVAVAERDGIGREEVVAGLDGLSGAEAIEGFAMPRIDVSSTLIRARVAAGLPIRYLVPDAVAERIADRGLYREPAGRAP
ncbi:MAG: nicotinate (nicotinamide) nucleotide adenylyltransferase [Solirubrobacterales bacterium]|nr:nicotinate (nicotinamide) nucleotide adenylyltransferase [Solirubrobacterales bacterium]